jgi:hypothetical protein
MKTNKNNVPVRQSVMTAQEEQALLDRMAKSTGLSALSKQTEQTRQTVPTPPIESIHSTQSTQPTQSQRMSAKHRKASLDEYRETFLIAPKITDRQPVFVSREVRDRIDSVVRRLGERKMSVSGFLENLARHHLDLYADDLEQWKRL